MPNDDMVIRPLAEEDLPAYRRLRLTMLQRHPEAYTSDALSEVQRSVDWYRARLGTPRVEAGHFTLGAFIGAGLVGAVSCERDARSKARHIAHLSGMMVAESARRRGVGGALLKACIDRARQARGLERLTLNITVGNEVARRMYVAAGFQRYGLLERALKIGDRYADKEMMLLVLESPAVTA